MTKEDQEQLFACLARHKGHNLEASKVEKEIFLECKDCIENVLTITKK